MILWFVLDFVFSILVFWFGLFNAVEQVGSLWLLLVGLEIRFQSTAHASSDL